MAPGASQVMLLAYSRAIPVPDPRQMVGHVFLHWDSGPSYPFRIHPAYLGGYGVPEGMADYAKGFSVWASSDDPVYLTLVLLPP